MNDKQFGVRQVVEHPEKVKLLFQELCENVPRSKEDLEKRKRSFSARFSLGTVLNRDLLAVAEFFSDVPSELLSLLKKRSIRTQSGVSPIGILTAPYPCPGKCVYCPTEQGMPKSYLSSQPAAARAKRNAFDPFFQIRNRLLALEESGHPTSKLEVIVMGGTWSALPYAYQEDFIKKVFYAANVFSSDKNFLEPSTEDVSLAVQQVSLEELQRINEQSDHRIIGLTLETRPDWVNEEELMRMRNFGCTRIELGVQTLDDEVQQITRRGHTREDVRHATALIKSYGFKVCYHLMPGLPGSTLEKDFSWMQEVFSSEDFCPDFLKIYPCLVLPGSEVFHWWEQKKFFPLPEKDLVKLLLKFKKIVPPYVRIMRLMRDIPANEILDGTKISNLRQLLKENPQQLEQFVGKDFLEQEQISDWPCQCVRCREIGFASESVDLNSLKIVRRDYRASEGQEVFLSIESVDQKYLFSLLRLRKPFSFSSQFFSSALHDAALIREVHSYGNEISVGEGQGMGQHRGLGKKLILEAERIAQEEWNVPRMSIIAGVGTRDYYRKFGYELCDTYMTKNF